MKKAIIVVAVIIAMAGIVHAQDFNFNYFRATLMNQDPDPAVPGEEVELRWKVEKFGNLRAEDVSFSLEAPYPFSIAPGQEKTMTAGNWVFYSDEENYLTLTYTLRVDSDALEGNYDVELFAISGGSRGSLGTFEVRVDEKDRPSLVMGSVVTSPAKLVADTDEAKLVITLENIGDGDAENVMVTIAYPEGFSPSYSFADQANLGTIAADGSAEATFYADIDEGLAGGEYEAAISLRYKEAEDTDNELRIQKVPFMIPLMDKPAFEISSYSTIPGSVGAGDTVRIQLKVRNVGGREAESVSVRAFKDSSQPFEFDEKSDFIGKLAPGEEGDAILMLTVDKDAEQKRYKLDIEVRSVYEDSVLIEPESVIIEVDHVESGSSPLIGIIIAVTIVAFGVGGYFFGKSRAPKKK